MTACGDAGHTEVRFIAHLETAQALIAGAETSGAILATSNWSVAQTLHRADYVVEQIEDLLTPQEIVEADQFVFDCVRGWYSHQGEDFTCVDGISLGEVSQYEMLHHNTYHTEAFIAPQGVTPFVKAVAQFRRLCERHTPSLIQHDLQPEEEAPREALVLVAAALGITVVHTPSPPSVGAQGWPRRDSGRLSLRRQVGRVKRGVMLLRRRWRHHIQRRRPSLFLMEYPSFSMLADRLRRQGFRVCTFQSSGQAALSPETGVAYQALRERWTHVKSDPAYRERFRFCGIDCFPSLVKLFDEAIDHHFSEALKNVVLLRRFYRKEKIRAVILPFDEPNFARLCVLTAQQLGIPAIVCQHGVFSETGGCRELLTANHVCVIADWYQEQVHTRRPEADVSVIGCLQLDRLTASRRPLRSTAELRASGAPLRILVLTLGCDTFSTECRAPDSEDFLQGVVDALEPFQDRIEVLFKLHPSEKQARYERTLKMIAPTFPHRIATGWQLPELLPQADLMISPVSTGVAEALCLNLPVIHFRSTTRPVPLPFSDGGCVPGAQSVEGLRRLVAPAVSDYEMFLKCYDFHAARQYFGPQDGLASERLAAVVSDICARQGGADESRRR